MTTSESCLTTLHSVQPDNIHHKVSVKLARLVLKPLNLSIWAFPITRSYMRSSTRTVTKSYIHSSTRTVTKSYTHNAMTTMLYNYSTLTVTRSYIHSSTWTVIKSYMPAVITSYSYSMLTIIRSYDYHVSPKIKPRMSFQDTCDISPTPNISPTS